MEKTIILSPIKRINHNILYMLFDYLWNCGAMRGVLALSCSKKYTFQQIVFFRSGLPKMSPHNIPVITRANARVISSLRCSIFRARLSLPRGHNKFWPMTYRQLSHIAAFEGGFNLRHQSNMCEYMPSWCARLDQTTVRFLGMYIWWKWNRHSCSRHTLLSQSCYSLSRCLAVYVRSHFSF